MMRAYAYILTLGREHIKQVGPLSTLNANDITFVVRVWVRSTDYWDLYFDMQQRFYTELPLAGFSFAYPQLDVTMLPTA